MTNTDIAKFQGQDFKFHKELMVTNIPEDFDKIMDKKVEYKVSRPGRLLFSSKSTLDFHPFQYIPFISDCDEFGSFIPIWRLLRLTDEDKVANSTIEGNCTLLKFEET